MKAIGELRNQGYALSVDHDVLVIKYTGQGHPDPATVKPLLAELRAHKQDAIIFLRQEEQSPVALYQHVSNELAGLWQAGTRGYLEQHMPELAQEIDQAEAQLNIIWLAVDDGAGSLDAFKVAIEQWRQTNLKAIRIYNDSLQKTRGNEPK
jgi:hypothetical protein